MMKIDNVMMIVCSVYLIDLVVWVCVMVEFVEVECCYDVCVLFVCELGSCGWGFVLLDSDYDVCFVYVYWCDWYLSVEL